MDSDYPSVGTKDFASYWHWKQLEPGQRETFDHATFDAGYDAAMETCRPYLRAYAHRLWIDGQLNENTAICRLLGEPDAVSHELGEDAP